MWWSVWLVHETDYVYAEGETVRTIWGYVKKNGDVYRPLNARKPSKEKVGDLSSSYKLSGYTTIVPTTTSLVHLL